MHQGFFKDFSCPEYCRNFMNITQINRGSKTTFLKANLRRSIFKTDDTKKRLKYWFYDFENCGMENILKSFWLSISVRD